MKKSRKRNGGGDFSNVNCKATPLTDPIGLDNILPTDQLNLQPIGHTKDGQSSTVQITKCITPKSLVNEFALRILRSSVSID